MAIDPPANVRIVADDRAMLRILHDEIAALSGILATAKAEIAALPGERISGSHLPVTADDLDAVAAHTARATETILDTCETLDRVGNEIEPVLAAQLQTATTRIYEACGFQDIASQRIRKVVATLQAVDHRVAQLMATFAVGTGGRGRGPAAAPAGEGRLLPSFD